MEEMRNAIFIVNIENPARPNRNAAYDLSIKSWKNWSERNNAAEAVYVLDGPIHPVEEMTPIIQRHYLFHLIPEDFDQVLMVDADTIVHPDCPNFFDLTEGKFAAVHNDGDYDWVIRSIENYKHDFKDIFKMDFNLWRYINCGFMVTNKKYKDFHDSITIFYHRYKNRVQAAQRYGVGTDQPLVNLFANEQGIEIKLLPYRYNMQDLSRKNILDDRMLFTEVPGIYHFNSIAGGSEESTRWIQKTYQYLYA